MSDNTARLRLPEIAQMQEMTSAQINDALLQLDALCSPLVLGLFVNDPPASPTDGDTYVTGGAPTGAWAGYAYKIAYCVDGGWRMFTPFDGLLVHRADTGSFAVYLNGQWRGLGTMLAGPEVSIASGATCDLGGVGALCVCITGTATITSLGTGTNALRLVRFAGALTLIHDAASLILPGGADIAAQPGDYAVFVSDGSGNWRCRDFARADGRMVNMGSPTFTGTLTGPDAGYWDATGIQNVKGIGPTNTVAGGYVAVGARNASNAIGAYTDVAIYNDAYQNGAFRVFSSAASDSEFSGPGATALTSGTGKLSLYTAANQPVQIGVNNSVVATINASGIGWGIAPSHPIDVHTADAVMARFAGTGANHRSIRLVNTAGYQNYISFFDGANEKFQVGKDSNNDFFVYDVTNGRTAFHVSSAGQVDLSSAPGQAVAIVAGGSGGVTLASGATAWASISDGVLKAWAPNQTDYRSAIRAIAMGDFTWKDGGRSDFGAVAQDLDAALAGTPLQGVFVQKPARADEPWRVAWDYGGRLALWGVKDLYAMIDALAMRVAALEASRAAG